MYYQTRRNNVETRKAERIADHREIVNSMKADRGCEHCSEADPSALDFHHRDPSTKVMNVSTLVKMGYGLARIEDEISVCDVLCANCHRKVHNPGTKEIVTPEVSY